MAEPESQRRSEQGNGDKLFTLSEISQRTGISMPTLQRYKKMNQSRIPAEGKGRKQRYPENSLPVFEELRVENAGRRGRPRKDASAPRAAAGTGRRGRKAAPVAAKRGGRPRKAAAAAKPAKAGRRGGRKAAAAGGRAQRSGNLLTLTEVSKQTGISYPTLVRYVRVHSNRLPSEGAGRARRFHPEAVDVFRQLRSESGRGGRKPAAAKTGRGPGRPRGRAAAASGGNDSSRLKALERAQQDLEKRF